VLDFEHFPAAAGTKGFQNLVRANQFVGRRFYRRSSRFAFGGRSDFGDETASTYSGGHLLRHYTGLFHEPN